MRAGWVRPQAVRPEAPAATAPDAGFTLVEVVVSFVLFAILSTTAGMALASTLKASAGNEARVVAANLVARQMETIQGQTATAIVDGDAARQTVILGGRTYYLDQTSTYDTAAGTGSACSGASGPAAYKRVTVTASWDRMEGVSPVHTDTIKALGVLGLSNGTGVLTVPVQDDAAGPVAGVPVTVGTTTKKTASDGCAVFPGLAPGTSYVASVPVAGDVGLNSNPTVTSSNLTVVAGEITKAPALVYSPEITLGVTVPSPAGYQPVNNLPITLANPHLPTVYKVFPRCANPAVSDTDCSTDAGSGQISIKHLFPVATGYQAWAGICATGRTGTTQTVTSPDWQGSTPSLGGLAVSIAGAGATLRASTAWATNLACPSEAYSLSGQLGLGGTATVSGALPPGTWQITVVGTDNSTSTAVGDVTVTSGGVVGGGSPVVVNVS